MVSRKVAIAPLKSRSHRDSKKSFNLILREAVSHESIEDRGGDGEIVFESPIVDISGTCVVPKCGLVDLDGSSLISGGSRNWLFIGDIVCESPIVDISGTCICAHIVAMRFGRIIVRVMLILAVRACILIGMCGFCYRDQSEDLGIQTVVFSRTLYR
jgi:hypothetical protein